MKHIVHRFAVPSALAVSACSPIVPAMDAGTDAGQDAGMDGGIDAGYDAGTPDGGDHPCPGPDYVNEQGMRCTCQVSLMPLPDAGTGYQTCCDPDIGNPCPVCCGNPRDADGGRGYFGPDGGIIYTTDTDAGQPVCLC
jgi:hypothetical protein